MPVSQRKKQRSAFYSGPAELYPEFRSNDGDTEKEPGGEKRAHAGIADGVQSTGKGRCHRQGRGVSGDYDHYRGFLHAGENTYQYCRFERIDGDVKATAI